LFSISQFTFEPNSGTLVFRADNDTAAGILGVLERLDIDAPEPTLTSVELTTHVLIAPRSAGRGADLPESLTDVVEQLSAVLPYGSYNLMESAITRVIDGKWFSIDGILPALPGEPNYEPDYTLEATMNLTGNGQERTLRIDDLTFVANVPVSSDIRQLQIRTSVDIREAEHVVVGKASVADAALILVMSADVIE
jgi:hypothetical protein